MIQVRSLKTGMKFKDTPIGKIPVDWEVIEIEKICDILDGKRIPLNKEQRDTIKGDIPYYGANGVLDYINDFIFDEDLILLAEDGGYFIDYKNRPIAYLIHGKSWVNNHAHVLRVKGHGDTTWVYYSLVHKNITPFIKGGTRSKLNQSDLRQIPIPLPPVSEQKKIAEVLSTVDDAIEETDRIIEKTKEVKKGLMQTMFTRGIGNNKSIVGQVTESWGKYKLNKLFILIKSGLSRRLSFQDIGIPMLRSANINKDGRLDFSDLKYWHNKDPQGADTKEYILKSGDLLINFINSLSHIGKCGLFEKQERDYIYTTNIFRAKTNDKLLLPKYFFYYSQTEKFIQQIESITKPAVNQASFTKSDLLNLKMVVPSIQEQEYIIEVLDSISFELLSEHNNKNNLETLKKSLMQVLLTGKVRVKVG